jgi:hypothetical protein
MTTHKTSPTLYDHPDGFVIGHAESHLIIIDDMGVEIHLPIGPRGLTELGLKMMAVGVTAEALAAFQLAARQTAGGAH